MNTESNLTEAIEAWLQKIVEQVNQEYGSNK